MNYIEIGKLDIEIIDGDRGKNYPHPNELFPVGDCLFLSAENVTKNGFSFSSQKYITRDKDAALRNGKLQRGDIVLTTRGTVGNVAYYSTDVPFESIRINSGMLILRTKSHLIPEYLYYVLTSKYFKDQLSLYQTGSAQPQLPKSDLQKIKIPVFAEKQQLVICRLIGTLRKKIIVNNEINGCLDAQAEAIYRTMMLRLESEDATVGKLSSLLDFRYGKDHKQVPDGLIPIYGSGGIMRYGSKQLYNGESVLVPRKGSLNNVMYVDEAFWTVDTMFYSIPKISNAAKFSYHFLRSMDLSSLNAGSAVPSMTTDILNSLELRIPSSADLKQFEEGVAPLYEAISKSKEEIKRLVEIRDSLLPKLMSGEIDIDLIKIG